MPSLVAITVAPKFVGAAPATPERLNLKRIHGSRPYDAQRFASSQSASLYLALNRFWIVAPRSFGSTRTDFLNH